MTEDGGRMTDDRRRMTDDRGQMTEDRCRMTEDGLQMTEGFDFGIRTRRRPIGTDYGAARMGNAEWERMEQRA